MIDNELLALEHKEVRLKKLSVKPYQNSNYPSGIYIVVIKEGNLLVSQHKLIKK
jgi:hypothetical protein